MVGNISNYTKIDVLRCILKLGKYASRAELSKVLDLGEGTIRTILDILKDKGLTVSDKKGHILNTKGFNILNSIGKSIKEIRQIEDKALITNQKKFGILMKNTKITKKAYELRDIAVKNGAEGALIFSFTDKLRVIDVDYDKNFIQLEKYFNLGKNDVLIVSYADSYRLAEHGAFAAAVELNAELKKLFNMF